MKPSYKTVPVPCDLSGEFPVTDISVPSDNVTVPDSTSQER